jgi:hypothetical protein
MEESEKLSARLEVFRKVQCLFVEFAPFPFRSQKAKASSFFCLHCG